jgi:hypothetical protein
VVYHCRSWLNRRHGMWVRVVGFLPLKKKAPVGNQL